MPTTQIIISAPPFSESADGTVWTRGQWPCHWIRHPQIEAPPFVAAFCKTFSLECDATFRAHVAADERYELFLDGQFIGRGSERGELDHWFFDSYDFDLKSGAHVLVARVWAQGEGAPFAQVSAKNGFLFCPQDKAWQDLLATGVAAWDCKILGGYEWIKPLAAWGTGDNIVLHGDKFPWGFENGNGDDWTRAEASHTPLSLSSRVECLPLQLLTPAILPPMLNQKTQTGKVRLVAALNRDGEIETHDIAIRAGDHLQSESCDWQELLAGGSTLVVPPHTRRRVLLDLENYFCAYPEITTSGGRGSTLRVHWQEALYNEVEPRADKKQSKGNRDEIEGKYFVTLGLKKDGVGDTFLPDGGAHRNWSTLWWQCGRYVEIVVDTQGEALTLESFAIRETRYPLEMESVFESSDTRLQKTIPIMVRALQMCAHETYMDCPYYEQLQYIGDTRLEVLATYALTRDDRLPRKALQLFDWSRRPEGLTSSRYPSRVRQIIPPFSLWWVAMVHDFALWRGDLEFVRSLMPGVRAVLDAFRAYQDPDGLLHAPDGWNFCDWVPAWENGVPPDGDKGISGVSGWQVALVSKQAAELESWLGETEMSHRHHRFASEVASATNAHFWNAERGLFADDLKHENFSEHAQCLALLSGFVPDTQKKQIARGLIEDQNLSRTTIYFAHYLFEAYREIGRIEKLFERLELWFGLEAQGFKTTFEEADWNTSRSDCHAWGAHPLFHYFATILGIRPTTPGFSKVVIAPQIGELASVAGTLPIAQGEIKVALKREAGVLAVSIELPEGVEGEFIWDGQTLPLRSAYEKFALPVTS